MNNSMFTIMKNTYAYAFVQTHRMYNAKSDLLCKLWSFGDRKVLM